MLGVNHHGLSILLGASLISSKDTTTFFFVVVPSMVDNALRKKVEVKMTTDFNSCNQTIPCVSPFCLEKQFQVLYAYAKFKKVQREVWGMICCNYVLVSKEGCISTYNVLDEISTDDHVKTIKYLVYYNEEECDVKCMCTLFEMRGILCRHVFKVFQMKKIYVLPNKYVLDQWRNDLKRIYTLVKTSYDNLRDNANARMYEVVVKRCLKLATHVSSCVDHVIEFM